MSLFRFLMSRPGLISMVPSALVDGKTTKELVYGMALCMGTITSHTSIL